MVELVDFLSEDAPETPATNTVSVVGHTIFLFTNVVNFIYLIFFEGFIHRRWSRNVLSQIMTFGVVAQMVSCVASISRHNMDDEYQKTLSWIGATALHIGLTTMNICSVFLFFNINYKKYIFPISAVAVVICIVVTIIEFVFWDSYLFWPGRILLLLSAFWQTVSIISAFVAHRKHKLRGTVADDAIGRQLVFAVFLQCFATGCVVSGLPILKYPGTGIYYFNFVALGLSIGTMDFMPHDQREHITYAATSGDEETAEEMESMS